MSTRARPIAPGQPPIELSEAAQEAAAWLRVLARGLRTFRIYRADNPVVAQARQQLANTLTENINRFGGWELRFTPNRIYLEDEPVVQPEPPPPGEEIVRQVHHDLPFLFYRDGIRRIVLMPGLPLGQIQSFFDALTLASGGPNTQDDLVTLLWQSNLSHIKIDAVPLEQTIYLSSRRTRKRADGERTEGQVYAWTPSGSEIRSELGQALGSQGLHLDTFDDWELPWKVPDVREAYERLLPLMDTARARFPTAWERERETEWTTLAPLVLRRIHAFDPSLETRRAVAHAVVTWLGAALHEGHWSRAVEVLAILREFDPDHQLVREEIVGLVAGIDVPFVTEKLDEAEAEDHARFAALVVALGQPMLRVALHVLAEAQRVRVRAAATAAITSLCAEQPELLTPFLDDARWHVVRNVVFVLGQIGGEKVAAQLRTLSRHPEMRVRRQVVHALGSVPAEHRLPVLIGMLEARESQVLAAALQMLTREPSPEVERALLERIQAPEFEYRSEEAQRTLYSALAEVATDDAVPALEAVLHRGGWFAKRTLARLAAARTLARIGTERSLAVLEAALRSRSEAVRQCALEAMSMRSVA